MASIPFIFRVTVEIARNSGDAHGSEADVGKMAGELKSNPGKEKI